MLNTLADHALGIANVAALVVLVSLYARAARRHRERADAVQRALGDNIRKAHHELVTARIELAAGNIGSITQHLEIAIAHLGDATDMHATGRWPWPWRSALVNPRHRQDATRRQ